MNMSETFITGISPEHVPAFIAALLLIPGLWLGFKLLPHFASRGSGRASSLISRWQAASYARRLTALLLLTSGVIHFFLPFGHESPSLLDLTFWASGDAFLVVAFKSLDSASGVSAPPCSCSPTSSPTWCSPALAGWKRPIRLASPPN